MNERMIIGARVAVGLAILLFGLPTDALIQGKITGYVLDGMTGQPVRAAAITIEGTEDDGASDVKGLFRMNLAPGSYTLVVSKEGYETRRVTEVLITEGELTNISAVLLPLSGSNPARDGQATFQEEVTVTAEASSASETALLVERKAAAQISDSIGTEEIGKNTGSDAAGALKRVTGISLQDNKYVYIRGLGDRYSNTTLNGSKMPSTEFEKKVVPLDLFPADLLDKITVSKSYTVDKPGDFVAGFVELVTKNFPDQQAASIGFSLGLNSVTTGEPYLEYGSGLGFSGSGGQALPATVPAAPLVRFSPFSGSGFTSDELEAIGEDLIGVWSPTQRSSAPFESNLRGNYGNSGERLGFVLSANYENGFATRDEESNIYAADGQGGVTPLNTYTIDTTTEKVRQAITGNLSYRLGDNHHLNLRSIFTSLSEAESRFQEGFFSDIFNEIEDFRVSFQEQEVFNVQLAGDHYFGGSGAGGLLEWSGSFSNATTDENRREVIYEELNGEFVLTDNGQSGFMYFNDLQDDVVDGKVHWTSFLNRGTYVGSVKAGLAYTNNERAFAGRRLRYAHRSTFGIDLTLSPEELFSEDLIKPRGFEIQEITRATDFYRGDHQISAAYAQGDFAWGKWRIVGGLRVEDSDQEVITLNRFEQGTPLQATVIEDTNVLPAVNLTYQLSPAANLRFSASQTVNRPEYRELAPFRFTHLVGGFAVTGNPGLQQAEITSLDARWEWFPSSGEVVAASVFYKDFERPIENVLVAGASLLETYANAESARNLGAELEARRNLGSLIGFLEGVTVILNYTFVDSEISLDPNQTTFTNAQRALVGQPDNVLNAIVEWTRPESGSLVRLLVNFTDDKVARGGGFGQPDVFEEARTTVDLVYRQDLDFLLKGLSLKLSASNLFDEPWEWTQGGEIFRRFDPGTSIKLSASYRIF